MEGLLCSDKQIGVHKSMLIKMAGKRGDVLSTLFIQRYRGLFVITCRQAR